MGVKGLWRLLMPIGRRISIETLEGKVLAIDASIWLTQFLKAMRDPDTGSVKPAAHLIGFFRRLAKLRYHGIRPVLVFDGATPEIKKREVQQRRQRREQFASTGQVSMERLAKRLLLEQLKKKKKRAIGSTSNGGSGAYAAGFQPAQEETIESSPAKGENMNPATSAASKDDSSHEAILAEVADLEDQWAIQASLETENDFDNAVIHVDSEQQQEESQTSIYNHTQDVIDLKRISSLPSHERKDAVEEAKRQQRMRSRREFMPVAGQPEEYSQTQLRNFLRSSKLNRDIAEMAKQAAGNDDGIGERMASDATRRIVLTRDDDQDTSASPWRRLQKRASAFRASKLPPEEEDDEEFEWEDDEMAREDSARRETDTSGRTATVLVDVDSNEDYDEGGGGFMTSETAAPFNATKSTPIIQIVSNESDMDEGGGSGCGFISAGQASKSPVASKTVVDIDDDDTSGCGFLPQLSSDAKHAQELEDEMLARALQETENEPRNELTPARDPRIEQIGGQYSKETRQQVDSDALLAAMFQEEAKSMNERIDFGPDEDESDGVDWEDGEGTKEVEESGKKPASVANTHPSGLPTLPSQTEKGDGDSDSDDIAWEDGDCCEGTAATAETPVASPGSVETNSRKQFVIHKSNELVNAKSLAKGSSVGEKNGFDNVHVVVQNAEALQHAQETASHLTNWAGRAFRRAMEQHAEEARTGIPEKVVRDIIEGKESFVASYGDNDDDSSDSVEVFDDGRLSPSTPKQTPDLSRSTTTRTPPTRRETLPSEACRLSTTTTRESDTVVEQPFGLFQDASVSLQEQADILDAEARQQERDMDTITDEMKAEVIQLIQLFGIPYVESPAEAEAQCAMLEQLGLVDGIVTEDSDVFVFGGKTVYKNIFDDQKYVEAYLASDAKRDMKLNRNQFVALAMLLGGDYSEGVKGVGIVNGMEVLQAFDCTDSVKEGLSKFRKWMDGFDPEDARELKGGSDDELSAEQRFRRKHKTARTQWIAPKNFPADNVMHAYLKPVVDSSNDGFSWGTPDLDSLLVFCQRNMGWEHSETRKLLEPVMQRLEDTSRQTRLESFFLRYEDDIKFAEIKSKRLKSVFEDIQKKVGENNEAPKKKRAKTNSGPS